MKKLYKSFIAIVALLGATASAQISQPVGPGGRPQTFTNHGVLIGKGTANVVATSAGTAGLCLLSGGASADPDWGSCAGGSAGTVTDFTFVNANGIKGQVNNSTTTPELTLQADTGNGMIKVATNVFTAATSGTDYSAGTASLGTGIVKTTTGTGALTIAVAGDFPTLNQNTTGTASNVTGTVAVANGGTGLTATPTNGQIDIGNGTNFTRTTITAGTGITVTNGVGAITIAASGSTNNLQYAWGDCTDGNVTISSGTTTLTRDMHYNTLTLSGTGVLNTAGYRVYVCGALDISAAQSGAIIRNGATGNNGTAGAGGATVTGLSAGTIGGSPNSGGGGATSNGAGSASSLAAVSVNGGCVTNPAGNGGGGGAGATTPCTGANTYIPMPYPTMAGGLSFITNGSTAIVGGGASGSGGGGGSNEGGGGSGGTGGGVVFIAANTISRGTNSNTSIIQVKGGNGGNGGNPTVASSAGGGGSGGGGGFLQLAYQQLTGSTITNAIDLSGGTGGNGGTGNGGSNGGSGGSAGNSGRALVYNLGAGTLAGTAPVTGNAGSANSGSTGGAGASNQQRINL